MTIDEYIASKYDALDKDTCIKLITMFNGDNDMHAIMELVNEIAKHQYYIGYDDGYTRGEQSVYDELCRKTEEMGGI